MKSFSQTDMGMDTDTDTDWHGVLLLLQYRRRMQVWKTQRVGHCRMFMIPIVNTKEDIFAHLEYTGLLLLASKHSLETCAR